MEEKQDGVELEREGVKKKPERVEQEQKVMGKVLGGSG